MSSLLMFNTVYRLKMQSVMLGYIDPSCDPKNLGPNNYKGTKPQMSSLLVFNIVYRLEIQSVMLVYLTPLVN
jgi:hypothetical protein